MGEKYTQRIGSGLKKNWLSDKTLDAMKLGV